VIISGSGTGQGITAGSYTVVNGNYNGLKHIRIEKFGTGYYSDTKANLVLTYVAIDNVTNGVTITYSTGHEVSYCDITQVKGDHAIAFNGVTGDTWDSNSVHNNYLQVASDRDGGGTGADGIQNGQGTSYYNNTIESYEQTGGDNHQDGIQTGGVNTKIYNNIIYNMGNAGIYLDKFSGVDNVLIYNNVVVLDDGETGYQRAIEVQNEGAADSWSNVRTYNNTIIGTTWLGIHYQGTGSNPCTGCAIRNNLLRNGGGITVDAGVTGVVVDNNYQGNPGTVDLDVNFIPTASDTQARDQGVDLSEYFITDLLGLSRPAGAAFDLGAYEYAGADATPSVFSFGADVTGVELSTLTPSPDNVTVAGIDAGQTPAITVSGTGCEYAKDGGAFTADAGTVGLDNVVALRTTSSAAHNTTITCTVTIGGVSDSWGVTTLAAAEDATLPRMRASGRGGWR